MSYMDQTAFAPIVGIQELSFGEIDFVSGGQVSVSVKPTGGMPPKGATVTVKVPTGASSSSSNSDRKGGINSSGTNYAKQAADLYKKRKSKW